MTGKATRKAAAETPADILQRVYIQTCSDLDVSVHSRNANRNADRSQDLRTM